MDWTRVVEKDYCGKLGYWQAGSELATLQGKASIVHLAVKGNQTCSAAAARKESVSEPNKHKILIHIPMVCTVYRAID